MPEFPHAVKTRFAPSPTGGIHLGNARTVLFNRLFSRHAGGRFVLRAEDTDANVEGFKADLRWLGLDGLAGVFDLSRVGRSPPRFGSAQLVAWQRKAVDSLDADVLVRWAMPSALALVPIDLQRAFLAAVQPTVHRSAEVANRAHRLFAQWQPEGRASDATREAGEGFCACALEAFAASAHDPGQFVATLKRCARVSGRRLFMPLRMALTGEEHGPDIKTLLNPLPPERVSERLSLARNLAAQS